MDIIPMSMEFKFLMILFVKYDLWSQRIAKKDSQYYELISPRKHYLKTRKIFSIVIIIHTTQRSMRAIELENPFFNK